MGQADPAVSFLYSPGRTKCPDWRAEDSGHEWVPHQPIQAHAGPLRIPLFVPHCDQGTC